ncbi:MAG: multifunctional nuclease/2,3-cyclic-nucleotide [Subtercola sp.]|nr:multifunctional nuclease/2,3-cyclic-nucleotide [Subtercola sp.]
MSRRFFRLAAVTAAITLALGLTIASSDIAAADPSPVNIDILSINDFHGRLEASGTTAGAAVLAGAVDSFRTANPNTLFVSAGDNIGASTFTSFIQKDQPTIDALNAMKLDVSSVGNHEFDQGLDDLQGRVESAADFPYLAANVFDKATGAPAFDQYFVKEVDGIRVGFVGAVTEELPSLVSPAGISSISVGGIVPSVNKVADQLKDGDTSNGEADVIVLLVHEGAATSAVAAPDSVFGKIVDGVDANVNAIVAGHTHQLYNDEAPVPGVPGATRPVLEAASYSMDLGHISLSVDPVSKALLSITSEVLPLTASAPPNAPLYPADPAVADIVTKAVAVADVQGKAKVGDITSDFTRATQSDASENRGGESTLGNFVADVQLTSAAGSGAQVAFMNPGGLRADLTFASSGADDPDGNVTYKEAASVQPFANTLVTMQLTGDQIRTVLNEQWQPAAAARPFLKLGVSKGLSYEYNPAAGDGMHVGPIFFDGALLAPTDTLKVVVNSFLASGGDNFFEFANGADPADSGKIDLQSMVDYFEANSIASPDPAQRAIGVSFETPPASDAGFAAGQTITADLSSLLFSTGAVPGATVDIVAGSQVLASARIDPAIVDTTDEVGRAVVTFTIPADAAVGQAVTLQVASTGTTAPLLVVGSASAVTSPSPSATPAAGASGGSASLANTGASGGEAAGWAGLGMLGIAFGVIVLVGARRRRSV